MKKYSIEEIIGGLRSFWQREGAVALEALDLNVGAGTFHPETFFRALGPNPWFCCFCQPSRRPADGRYGENPNRCQLFHQFQVFCKPAPKNLLELYFASLEEIGISQQENDIRLLEDNWSSPTLGAWGLGWEVRLNGLEITQYTYFQQVGGISCSPVGGEIAYGVERLALQIQEKDSVFDLTWSDKNNLSYRDLFFERERQGSFYNFQYSDCSALSDYFNANRQQAELLLEHHLPEAAYEMVLMMSNIFNLLDARRTISAAERPGLILQIRRLACRCAKEFTSLVSCRF